MRQQFVEAKTIKDAKAKCPWAEKVVKVDGGYRAFESTRDYETWKKQR